MDGKYEMWRVFKPGQNLVQWVPVEYGWADMFDDCKEWSSVSSMGFGYLISIWGNGSGKLKL